MRLRKTITTIVATAILLAGWQLFAVIANQPELIPSLPRLVRTLCEWLVSGSFYQSVGATILRGILGMSISFVCAIGMAGLFARFEWVYELFRPLLAIMRSIPVISFILLALIFLNPESIPLMIAFLTMFPLLTENLTRGILDLRPGLSIMARQFHIKRSNVLFQIIYPQLKPFLYSGLASAAGFGWRAIIMGEVLSQCAFGIGSEMKRAQNFIAVPELLAWTIVAVFISFFFDKGISKVADITPKISFANEDQTIPTPTLSVLDTKDISYQYGIQHFSHSFQKGIIYGISAPSGNNVIKPNRRYLIAYGRRDTSHKTLWNRHHIPTTATPAPSNRRRKYHPPPLLFSHGGKSPANCPKTLTGNGNGALREPIS